jgi:hypothetical protein
MVTTIVIDMLLTPVLMARGLKDNSLGGRFGFLMVMRRRIELDGAI